MMAFHVRIKNGISNTISGQDKTTRWKGFLKCLTQHSQLSLRKLRLTSAVTIKVIKSENFLKYFYISLFVLKQGEWKHYITIPYNTGENNRKRNFSVSVLWPISKSQIACPLIITSISMKGLSRLLEGNMSYSHVEGENVTAPRRYLPSYIAKNNN